VLAIALGWVAHSEIEKSGGRVGGRGLASAGIGLGITNLVLTVVGVGVLVAFALRTAPAPRAAAPTATPVPVFPAPVAPPATPPALRPAPPPAEVAEAEPALPVLPPQVGKIVVVDANGARGLEGQLLTQLAESKAAGEQVVLWTVTTECEPCDAVGRALPDARMQRALGNVRLIRADAASFPVELRRLGVPIDTVPGFTLLDSQARAQDHIHGGEWDADIPANIAPILDKFVKHALSGRRHPWSRPLRDGETTL
jgi:hypothetical protein